MGELADRQELLARLSRPESYPGREEDTARFLDLDRDLYQDRLLRLPDIQLRQEYLAIQDRIVSHTAGGTADDFAGYMLENRGDAVMREVGSRSGLPDLTAWHPILNHHPVAHGLQSITAAEGTRVNLDYYYVEITRAPLAPDGHRMSPPEVLDAMRADFNGMLQRGGVTGSFTSGFDRPIPPVEQTPQDGPYIHIGLSVVDDGTVALTENTPQHFRLSTVSALGDLEHPVSGSRDFGFELGPVDNFRIYTRGADRPTGLIDDLLDGIVFRGADHFWRGWQRGFADWVVAHGGEAVIVQPEVHHVEWAQVEHFLYRHDTHLWEAAAHAGLEHGAPPAPIDPPGPVIDLDRPEEAELELAQEMSLGQAPLSLPLLDPSVSAQGLDLDFEFLLNPSLDLSLDPSQAGSAAESGHDQPIDWSSADPSQDVSGGP